MRQAWGVECSSFGFVLNCLPQWPGRPSCPATHDVICAGLSAHAVRFPCPKKERGKGRAAVNLHVAVATMWFATRTRRSGAMTASESQAFACIAPETGSEWHGVCTSASKGTRAASRRVREPCHCRKRNVDVRLKRH